MNMITAIADTTGLPVACPVAAIADQYEASRAEDHQSFLRYFALSPYDRRLNEAAHMRDLQRRGRRENVLIDTGLSLVATSKRGLSWQAEMLRHEANMLDESGDDGDLDDRRALMLRGVGVVIQGVEALA